MPVRSLRSSVLKWPDQETVLGALRRWTDRVARKHENLRRLGYCGSYARGDWGVGSDLDIIVVVADSPLPFERRAVGWDATELPVPADVLVYTEAEWRAFEERPTGPPDFVREAVWILE